MNESDKKVRKQFLGMWVISILMGIGSIIVMVLSTPAAFRVPVACGGTTSLLSTIVFFFVAYRCAYKKPGTKLLTFFLIMSVMSLTLMPFLYSQQSSMYVPYYPAYLAVGVVMQILWLVVCWNMRKMNKRLQTLQ